MRVTTTGATAGRTLPQAQALITDWATGAIAHTRATPTRLRVRLTPLPEAELVLGQLNAQIDGRALRCQASAPASEDAGLLLIEALSRKLAHPDGQAAQLLPTATPGLRPTGHPAEITRRKNATLQRMTPGAAARWMIDHDYAAHLYTGHTGGEALVCHDPRGGFRILQSAPHTGDAHHVPALTEHDALALVTATREQHLFFTDHETRRGALLYARYAGGYGLLRALS
jgi:hypothetical protein